MITYGDIRKSMIDEFKRNNKSEKQIENHNTALNKLLEYLSDKNHAVINDLCLADAFENYEQTLKGYLLNCGLSPSTVPGRKTCLNNLFKVWKKTVVDEEIPSGFGCRLKYLKNIKNVSFKDVEKTVNIPSTNLCCWANEIYYPSIKSLHYVEKLERYFCVKSGFLKNELPIIIWGSRTKANENKLHHAYTEKLKVLIVEKYALSEQNYTLKLRTQLDRLIKFYLSKKPIRGLRRRQKIRKTTLDQRLQCLKSFFGFCLLPFSETNQRLSGLGMSAVDLTLALVARTDIVEKYTEFLAARNIIDEEDEEVYTQRIEMDLQFFKALLHEKYGYVRQCNELKEDLGKYANEKNWGDICDEAKNCYLKLIKETDFEKVKPSEAEIPIILNSEHPMRYLIEFAQNIKKSLLLSKRDRAWYIRARDYVIVEMMIGNPLRRHNFSMMKLGINLAEKDGIYWLHFDPKDFKNERGAARDPYHAPFSFYVSKIIGWYLKEIRPHFYNEEISPYVFLPIKRGGKNRGIHTRLSVLQIYRIIKILSLLFIPRSIAPYGLRPQLFRHIIATDIVRNRPDGFVEAAKILHDSLDMIVTTYQHVRQSDWNKRYNEYLEKQISNFVNSEENGFFDDDFPFP